MILDGFALQGLLHELRPLCVGARVDKIAQPGPREIQLLLRKDRENRRLCLLPDPAHPALVLGKPLQNNPQQAPQFCMVLRKHLLGAKLLDIEAPGWERVVFLEFEHRDELGDLRRKTLVLELLGRQSNLILLQDDGRILDALIHVDESMSKTRCISPARPYVRPPRPDRLDPENLVIELQDPIAWRSKRLTEGPEAPLEDWFLHTVFGVSPWLAHAWAEVCCGGAETQCRNIRTEGIEVLCESLKYLLNQKYKPTCYRDAKGQMRQLHILRYARSGYKIEPIPSILETYGEHLQELREQQLRQTQQATYLNPLRNRIRQLAKKEKLLLQDQEEAKQAEEHRIMGELLLSNLHLVRPGMESITVSDFYAEDPTTQRTILLDPSLSPSQLAQKHFKLYAKQKTRLETAARFYEDTHEERLYCERLAALIEQASDPEDWKALIEEWNQQNAPVHRTTAQESRLSMRERLNPGKPGKRKPIFPASTSKRKKAQNESAPLPPRSFTLPSGHILEIGRNNLQNDRLSLRSSQKNDLWFHRKGFPGPHAVLHLPPQSEATEEECSLAASLCAWFSLSSTQRSQLEQNGGSGEKMEIDCSPISQVWKPKGARPGRVEYRGQTTYPVLPRNPESL